MGRRERKERKTARRENVRRAAETQQHRENLRQNIHRTVGADEINLNETADESRVRREATRQRAERKTTAGRTIGADEGNFRGQKSTPRNPRVNASTTLKDQSKSIYKSAKNLVSKGSSASRAESAALKLASGVSRRAFTGTLYGTGVLAVAAAAIDTAFVASDFSEQGETNASNILNRTHQGQQLFGMLGPTAEAMEKTHGSAAKSFHDFLNDPEGVIGAYNPSTRTMDRSKIRSQIQDENPYVRAKLPSTLPGRGEEPIRDPYRARPEGNREYVKDLDEARRSIDYANEQADANIDSIRSEKFGARLKEAGLLTRPEKVRMDARDRKTELDTALKNMGISADETNTIRTALASFSEQLADLGTLDRIFGENTDPETVNEIEEKLFGLFENMNLSEEGNQAFFKLLKNSGANTDIIQAIGDRIGVTSVVDQEGELVDDGEPFIKPPVFEDPEEQTLANAGQTVSRKGKVIYSGMVNGTFVAQDTPGPGLTASYDITTDAGDISPIKGGSSATNLRDIAGPGLSDAPGATPGDESARDRLFKDTRQRKFDSVNAENEARQIRFSTQKMIDNAQYDNDVPPSLRVRNITNPQANLDYADKLEDETELGLLNKKAAQRGGRNIPGMTGAELAQIPVGKALTDIEDFPTRLAAIYELDSQAQKNMTAELESPQFASRVNQLIDPDGTLRDLARRGLPGAAGNLARARTEGTRQLQETIANKHASVVPRSLRDQTIDQYRAGLTSTKRALRKERKGYIEERISSYTDDPDIQSAMERSARLYGLYDMGGDNDYPDSFIEERVSDVYVMDKIIDTFQKVTNKTISSTTRSKALKEKGYAGILDLVNTMIGDGGDFYFRDASLSGLNVFNKADRSAVIDQIVSAISFGIAGDTSDDTIIFENKRSGKRIKAEDLHGGDGIIKERIQAYLDQLSKPKEQ